MTESEWLTLRDPNIMLAWLWPEHGGVCAPLRKLRLFLLHAYPRARPTPVYKRDLEYADRVTEAAASSREMLAHHWSVMEGAPPGRAFRDPEAAADLLREIVGNPFRPLTLPVMTRHTEVGNVLRVAGDAYARVRRNGTLDADSLLVLADALEDAGCANVSILEHLRSPGPHVRGCWAVDLIMGKT